MIGIPNMLPPFPFVTVKQPRDSLVCVACVAAMATGESLRQVEAAMEPTYLSNGKHFYRTRELLAYLGRRGIHSGLVFSIDQKLGEQPRISFSIPLEGHPAVLAVRSQVYRDAGHVVFWDGRSVRDPNPDQPDETELAGYHVYHLIPLVWAVEPEEKPLCSGPT